MKCLYGIDTVEDCPVAANKEEAYALPELSDYTIYICGQYPWLSKFVE